MTSLELLNLTEKQKLEGVWIDGHPWEGEWKRWDNGGELLEHSKWKNGACVMIFEKPLGFTVSVTTIKLQKLQKRKLRGKFTLI